MNILLDTNILARLAEPGHAMHQVSLHSTKKLNADGHTLCIVPQNLYELWVVSTRPLGENGLGKTVAQTALELSNLIDLFKFFEDTPAVFPVWQRLVEINSVYGKNAHDARLVAAMVVYGISDILTFNAKDFLRYQGITTLTPDKVANDPHTESQ